MAILSPQLTLCFGNTCKLKIIDSTGIYSLTNDEGYANSVIAEGVLVEDWMTGLIQIFPLGSSTSVFSLITVADDVTEPYTSDFTLYPEDATSEMELGEFEFDGSDGVYTITYTGSVIEEHELTPFSDTVLVYCHATACIESLASDYAANPTDTNLSNWLTAIGLLAGAQALFNCNKTANANKVTAMLTKICALGDCGCGCS